jgi:hypothetical protein
MQTLALDAIDRTGLGFGCEPWCYIVALGYYIRRVPRAPFRAELHGQLVTALWNIADGHLNTLIGFAMVVVREARIIVAPADVYRLTACLAGENSPYLPPWFVDARTRAPSRGNASGVWVSVRGRSLSQ